MRKTNERIVEKIELTILSAIVVMIASLSWQAALLIALCYVSHSVFSANMKIV
jgi:hypothetical protein